MMLMMIIMNDDNLFSNELIGDEKLNEEFRSLILNKIKQADFSIEYLAYGLQALEINLKKAFETNERSE
jgi:translation elongation factor EF-1beta